MREEEQGSELSFSKKGNDLERTLRRRVSRPKKYTDKTFEEAVERYFHSISGMREARNGLGQPILNDEGAPIYVRVYAVPPTISGLCLFLGIDRSTWQNYGDTESEPKKAAVVRSARARIEAYLEEQLLTREKSVQGIIFNLQNNYGWKNKTEVEIGAETRKSAIEHMSLSEKMAQIREAAKSIEALEGDHE